MAAWQIIGNVIYIAFAIFVLYCTVIMIKDLPQMLNTIPEYEEEEDE